MQLKCLFCKYKKVCVPEMESNLKSYRNMKKRNEELAERLTTLESNLRKLIDKYEHK